MADFNHFKAEIINGKIEVKPNIERKPNGDLTVHLPSLGVIKEETQKMLKEIEDGKRNIQQI